MDQQLHRELLIINSSHYTGDGYTFKYNLGRLVDFTKPGASVALYNLAMYNSTYNISTKFGNNTFSIQWIDNTVLNVTIPDGYYSYEDLSNLIQYHLIQNNWYWIVNNVAVYPITCTANTARYASQINIVPVPTASSGATKPNDATWNFPSVSITPSITINPKLGKIFGYSAQLTFPPTPQSTAYSYVSDITPQISPVYTYVITCNLLNTEISTNINNVLTQLPLNNSFGGLVTLNNLIPLPIHISQGKYSEIIIKFLDQNLIPINIIDIDITIILILEY